MQKDISVLEFLLIICFFLFILLLVVSTSVRFIKNSKCISVIYFILCFFFVSVLLAFWLPLRYGLAVEITVVISGNLFVQKIKYKKKPEHCHNRCIGSVNSICVRDIQDMAYFIVFWWQRNNKTQIKNHKKNAENI